MLIYPISADWAQVEQYTRQALTLQMDTRSKVESLKNFQSTDQSVIDLRPMVIYCPADRFDHPIRTPLIVPLEEDVISTKSKLTGLFLAVALGLTNSPASAAPVPKVGAACTKANATVIVGHSTLKCTKAKNKLVWKAITPTPITFGVVDSQTGATALGGLAQLCGTRVAVADINAAGGVFGGRKIKLETRDSQSTPSIAAQLATELTDKGIRFFVDAASSAQLLAMVPIFNDAKAIHGGGVSKATAIVDSSKTVVRVNSDSGQDAVPPGKWLNANAKTVVFLATQGAYGESSVAAFRANMGSNVKELKTIYVPADTTVYTSVMTQIESLNPDAVVFAISGNAQTLGMIRGWNAAGVKSQLIAPPGLLTPLVVQASGDRADGTIGSTLYSPQLKTPASVRLVNAFNKYADGIAECKDVILDDYVVLAYDQTLLFALGIDKAKSIDAMKVRATILANKWDLPQGTVSFQPNGQINTPTFYWIRAKNGRVVLAPDIHL